MSSHKDLFMDWDDKSKMVVVSETGGGNYLRLATRWKRPPWGKSPMADFSRFTTRINRIKRRVLVTLPRLDGTPRMLESRAKSLTDGVAQTTLSAFKTIIESDPKSFEQPGFIISLGGRSFEHGPTQKYQIRLQKMMVRLLLKHSAPYLFPHQQRGTAYVTMFQLCAEITQVNDTGVDAVSACGLALDLGRVFNGPSNMDRSKAGRPASIVPNLSDAVMKAMRAVGPGYMKNREAEQQEEKEGGDGS